MAVQNSLARQDQSMKLSVYLQNDAVKKQINQVVGGKNGTRFISSIVSAVQSTPALQECTSPSIVNAALLGEALNLSPSPQLGQFYMVPFDNKKKGCKEAQFQLGYKGYPGFQKALEELVRNKLNSIQRMEVTYGRISQSEILETVLQSDIDKIKMTLADIDHKAFDLAIDTLLNARRVYVIGIRSCAPLASFLGFYLNLVCDNVSVVDVNSSSEIFEQLIRINEHDVIIGISFPRYSMRTLKALEFASNRKAKVITLTDSVHSPMNLYSSCNLIARSDMASIVDSLVAPLSVVNALVVALCMKRQKEVVSTLETLEEIWGEYEVYSRDELDPMKRSFFPDETAGGKDE